MDAPHPLADLHQSRVRVHPGGPGITVADHLAGQVGEHLAPLIVEAQGPGNTTDFLALRAAAGRSAGRVGEELPYLLRAAARDGDLGGPLQRLRP